jgi:hypothetical protein
MPLGIVYFTVIVTGLSVGIGTLIIWIGVAVLAGTMLVAQAMGGFERVLANQFLAAGIDAQESAPRRGTVVQHFLSLLTNGYAWRSIVYLLLKLPLGIFSFTLTVTMLATSMSLILAPIFYQFEWYNIDFKFLRVDTSGEATLASLAGVVMLVLGYFAIRYTAWLHGRLAQLLLR